MKDLPCLQPSLVTGFYTIRFATSDAKTFANYLRIAMGFTEVAHRGLETDSLLLASHVLRNAHVVFEIVNTLSSRRCSPLLNPEILAAFDGLDTASHMALTASTFQEVLETLKNLETEKLHRIARDAIVAEHVDSFVHKHGFGIYDVVFRVCDCEQAFWQAVRGGAIQVDLPREFSLEHGGTIKIACVRIPKTDILHTIVESQSQEWCLPGYKAVADTTAPRTFIGQIDHCVQNYSWNEMLPVARFYSSAFGFHKYWSVDESDVSTGNSALRLIVMASHNAEVKMPINEPAESLYMGQIEEFYMYFNGPGVQHVALTTHDILETVQFMRLRNIEFNEISNEYYENLMHRLALKNITLTEDFVMLRKNHILCDFDPLSTFMRHDGTIGCNYILQISTKPFHDRPTFFLEIIQRYNHNGFGKGTFKGLFESIELEQKNRGTLVKRNLCES